MNLPKSIFPDNISDSIVEVRYFSKFPFEILFGIFFNSLDENYTFQNSLETDENIERIGGLFFNDEIKFQLSPDTIIFNCNYNYKGWDNYFNNIKAVLNQLFSDKIEVFTRVGVRYISEYNNKEIQNITKFDFTFGMPEIKSENFSFKSEFAFDECHDVILNLFNGINIVENYVATIDIDTIKVLNTNELSELFKEIEKSHDVEKKIFFNLLNDEFLNSLNPVY